MPWGQKVFNEYLGSVEAGKEYDSTELVSHYEGPKVPVLVDQGTADNFLSQLRPEALKEAFGKAGYPVTVRMQTGYDHSYYFISSFIRDHVEFHATNLGLQKRN